MPAQTLLVEIRCEELPPAQVGALGSGFAPLLLAALRREGFATESSTVVSDNSGQALALATPRRFAALLAGIADCSATTTHCRRGPALAACYDANGAPTKALQGFMRAAGVDEVDKLFTIRKKGCDYVAAGEARGGKTLAATLAAVVQEVLLAVNAPRLMRWGDNPFKFIRPLRGVLLLHGRKVLPGDVLGVAAGDKSAGHPVLAPSPLVIACADDYADVLAADGKVIVDINQRRQAIIKQFSGKAPQPAALLEEVVSMCEQPTVYGGAIDDVFLALPPFCIAECMIKHQRAFPKSQDGMLTRTYHFVADNRPRQAAALIGGMNTVLRARLRDVEFYLAEDGKLSLADARKQLEGIVYHHKLGSQGARVARLAAIAAAIGSRLQLTVKQQETLRQAMEICKSDLPTLMIGEYPALEGKMAAFYFCGHNALLAALVRCHASRDWKTTATAFANERCLAGAMLLALQLEKLVGLFAAGEKPSGSKDPHGLRAAAALAADILTDCKRALPLDELLNDTAAAFSAPAMESTDEVRQFIVERKRQQLLDKGAAAAVLNAVFAGRQRYLLDIEEKATALTDFLHLPQAAALIATHKRINNILRKSQDNGEWPTINTALFAEPAEHQLYEQLHTHQQDNETAARHDDYSTILANTAQLRESVDRFFEQVLVNTDNIALRQNRLALLAALKDRFNAVGDLSKLFGD